jgi:hypothetical protein
MTQPKAARLNALDTVRTKIHLGVEPDDKPALPTPGAPPGDSTREAHSLLQESLASIIAHHEVRWLRQELPELLG